MYHPPIDESTLYKTLKNECELPVMLAINRNLYAYVKVTNCKYNTGTLGTFARYPIFLYKIFSKLLCKQNLLERYVKRPCLCWPG